MSAGPAFWPAARRAQRVAALIVASVAQAACMVNAAPEVIPAEEIAGRSLDPDVDADMVFELAGYAAKDRLCAKSSRDRAAVMHEPYGHYIRCMYETRAVPCDVTADDLRTVHTLLELDPRLASIETFEQLLARLQSDCAGYGRLPATASAVRSWVPHDLERCEDRYQPVLITTAIMLRTRPPPDEEGSALWFAGCRGAAGYFFLDRHCLELGVLREQQSADAARLEQGIEAYFCPQIAKHFGA
jgi:hypothetical protein